MTTARGAWKAWGAGTVVFAATAGRPMAARGAALAAAVALPAAVTFGGDAVPPADVARWFHHFAALRALFLLVTSVVAAPVLAPALVAPGTMLCRSLPVARAQWAFLVAMSALVLQAPALLLFGAGGAFGDALALGCAAATAALAFAVRVADRRGIVVAVTAAIALVAGLTPWVAVPLTTVTLGVAAHVAWLRAPEAIARRGSSPRLVGGAPWCAVAVVHALRLLRQDAVMLLCWVHLAIGAGLLAALGVRNRAGYATTPAGVVALVVATLPLVLVTGSASQRVLDNERRLRWLLDATGTRRWERHGAAAFALSAIAVLTGALIAGTASVSGRWPAGDAARSVVACASWGVGLALLFLGLGRRILRERPKDRARFALGVAVLGGAALAAVSIVGQGAAYALLALAAAVSLLASIEWARRKTAHE